MSMRWQMVLLPWWINCPTHWSQLHIAPYIYIYIHNYYLSIKSNWIELTTVVENPGTTTASVWWITWGWLHLLMKGNSGATRHIQNELNLRKLCLEFGRGRFLLRILSHTYILQTCLLRKLSGTPGKRDRKEDTSTGAGGRKEGVPPK